jgi:aspartate carbamoyltransferase catalytic subunit
MTSTKQVLGPDDVRRATTRMAHEIIERNRGLVGVMLVGLQRGGVWLAEALAAEIARIEHPVPVGSVDVSLHRDDIALRPVSPGAVTDIPDGVDGAVVVLVDDVLYTGRTVRGARRRRRVRPAAHRAAGGDGRSRAPRAPHPSGLRRQEPADELRRGGRRRARRRAHHDVGRGNDLVVKHLRSIEEIGADAVHRLLDLSDHMAEVNRRPNPKVPALRGKTVCNVFFEDSTRTRLSFETAAKRLSADTMTFSVGTSSVNKGESLRDTIETIAAMGVDAFVVRHKSSGVPWQVAQWTTASVVNAGDGWHAHPTQALLDCFTIRTALGRSGGFDGLRIAIVGDIKHSRVARSNVQAFSMLGAHVTLVAPATLLPATGELPGATVVADLDDVVDDVDVLYLLRMQLERSAEALVPSLREYTTRYGLTPERARRLAPHALVMHPGPMNRGVEIAVDPSELPGAVITQQVTNGVAVRMAVLYDLLGSGARLEEAS